nr:MAG TPA: hypothetical protein [Caudoviricetes sp.]
MTLPPCLPRTYNFFDPYPLFNGSKLGSPSKKLTPRNILGLPNPHRARRRGGSTFPAAGPDGATAGRAGAGPPVGGAQGSGRPSRRRRKGAGG